MSTLQEIEAAVQRLPERERLLLADRILGSLPPPAGLDDVELRAEVEKREADLAGGKTRLLSEAEFWSAVHGRRE